MRPNRDRTTANSRLFNREGGANPIDRRELARHGVVANRWIAGERAIGGADRQL